MGLFSNKETRIVNVVELSDETRQALTKLENDLQVVAELLSEVTQTGKSVLGMLYGEAHSVETETVGVQVFATEEEKLHGIATEIGDRIRESPFKRRPRAEQITWLTGILADGEWHNAAQLATAYASEPREVRYLRNSINGRFREMHEDGMVERRETNVRGVMFEYRRIER